MIMETLKEHTRALHTQIEARINLTHQLGSQADYQQLLARFYGFYEPLEAHLGARPDVPSLALETRRKTPWLEHDLLQLGLHRAQLAQLPRCANLPALTTTAQTLGCLYVLEGATLGGQFIARLLKQQLSLEATNGAAFFNGYGGATGAQWKAFGAVVNAWAEQHGDEDLILQAARATFTTMDQWFAAEVATGELL